jgi:hypothetical protein
LEVIVQSPHNFRPSIADRPASRSQRGKFYASAG